jgi:Tfp pilus assembly protein PilX
MNLYYDSKRKDFSETLTEAQPVFIPVRGDGREGVEEKFFACCRGVAALPVISIIAMLILLAAIGAAGSGFIEGLISYSELENKQALFAAEAGAKDAFKRIVRNKNCNQPPTPTCDSYTLSVGSAASSITVSGDNPKTIISSGQVENIIAKIEVIISFDSNNKAEQTSWRQITD